MTLIGKHNCQSQVTSKSVCNPVFCVLRIVCSKHTKWQPDAQDAPTKDTLKSPLPPQILLFILNPSFPQSENRRPGGNKIGVGTVVKSKIGELEEEVRAGSSRRTRTELNGVVQGILGRRRLLARFKNGCKNNMYLNQFTVVIVEKILEEKEPEVSEIYEIPEEQVESENGYYCCVYVMLRFKKEVGVDSKEEQADVEDYTDEEDIEDVNLNNDREGQWRMVFDDNY